MPYPLLSLPRALSCFSIIGLAVLTACGGGGSGSSSTGAASTMTSSASVAAAEPATTTTDAQIQSLRSVVVANAGADQTVESLQTVTLNGTATRGTGLTPISYKWTQTAGPAVALNSDAIASPTFVTPFTNIATTLSFALVATIGTASSTSAVNVTVQRDSPWGVAPSSALTNAPETWAPEMASIGVTGVRGFNPAAAGDGVRALNAASMTTTGILWWSPAGTNTLPTADIPGWKAYVTSMVTRYKGQIKNWEVWNEPPNFTTDQSPASYGVTVAAAYDAAKAVDPTVQIGLAAKSNHVNYLAQAIDGGAANKFDYVTLHPYENAGLLTQGWEGQFMSIAPRVKTMLLDKNPAKAEAPVYFTEIGLSVAATGGVTPELQADGLAKIYTMSIAQGVAKTYWFSPRDAEGEYLGLTAADGTKRLAWTTMKTMSTYLGMRPTYVGWIQPGGAYYGFVFDGPKGTVLATWTRGTQPSTIGLTGSSNTTVDLHTGTVQPAGTTVNVSTAPMLLVAPADSAQAKTWKATATENATKPLAWYGDHSTVKTVSLSAATGPNGVFMLNPPTVTTVGGVAEFNMESRSGAAAFTVDPAFLAYTSKPIRITVTVRGHGTGDPGFNLKYESNAPLTSSDGNGLVASNDGWHRVASTDFYEKTWTIANPRFVGFYGYNFVLDSDGASHSQYSIQKVSVSK